MAAENDGIVYQGAPYEGLTVHFLELSFGRGRQGPLRGRQEGRRSTRRRTSRRWSSWSTASRTAPRRRPSPPTWRSRRGGRSRPASATFMRNWPYAYALGEGHEGQGQVRGRAAPRRSRAAARPASSAATTCVISAYSKNPGGALALIDYLTLEESRRRTRRSSRCRRSLPTIYDDPEVQKALPFAAELTRGASTQARPAPGVAGLPADLAGDLQERQRGAVGQMSPGGRDQAGAVATSRRRWRPSRPWRSHRSDGSAAEAALPGPLGEGAGVLRWSRRRWC